MKKHILLTTLTFSLISTFALAQNSVSLQTYYPAPSGNYDTLTTATLNSTNANITNTLTVDSKLIIDGQEINVTSDALTLEKLTVNDTLTAPSFVDSGSDITIPNGNINMTYGDILIDSGNIGIGTLAPAQELDITGDAHISGNLGLGVKTPTEKLQINGNLKLNYFIEGIPKFPHISFSDRFYIGSTMQVLKISKNEDLSQHLFSADFGIPSNSWQTLHLGGTADPNFGRVNIKGVDRSDGHDVPLFIQSKSPINTRDRLLEFGTSNNNVDWPLLGGFWHDVEDGEPLLLLWTYNNNAETTGSGYDPLAHPMNFSIISKNVGIGTKKPQAKLHVYGTSQFDADMNINGLLKTWGIQGSGVDNPDNGTYLRQNTTTTNSYSYIDLYGGGGYNPGDGSPAHCPGCVRLGGTDIEFWTGSTDSSYGDVSMILTSDGNLGIDTYSPSQKLHVNGNVLINGNLQATAFLYSSSDERLKENVAPIDDASSLIEQLNGVRFDWKENGESSIGFIAQDLEKTLPELVATDKEGYKSVAYGNITAVLVEALKEQRQMIKGQQTTINVLQKEVNELKDKIYSSQNKD